MQDSFRGSLSAYRLKLLVPALFEGPKPTSGTLRLSRGPVERTFVLKESSVVAASSNEPGEHLAQVLADLGILDANRSAAAFAAAKASGTAFGAFLVDRGFLDRPRLLEALEHKAREAFFDCYGWESGEVEFSAEPPPPVRGAELRLRLGPLHRDALARVREWKEIREAFPRGEATFEVRAHHLPDRAGDEHRQLLLRALGGATFDELLRSGRDGKLCAARRLLHLYRVGALVKANGEDASAEAPDVPHLLSLARAYLRDCDPQSAMRLATQVLEGAAVPEAHALYREAEAALSAQLERALDDYEGRLRFEPLPRAGASLTADDLYFYSHLRTQRSVREGVKNAAMGELGAYRSLLRLIASGALTVGGRGAPALQAG